jgi:hypothetical protein
MISSDLYDLSNIHFADVYILKLNGVVIRGKFVRIEVLCEGGIQVFPSEKLCFLPTENFNSFSSLIKEHENGIPFFPDYVLQISLAEIREIKILPSVFVNFDHTETRNFPSNTGTTLV